MYKIAFGSVPKDGGTFTFYRNLRPALRDYGIDLHCVTVGKREADLVDWTYADDGCTILASDTDDVKQQAQVFANWCQRLGIDSVMAINSVAILSALPHLSKHIRVISRCANGFEEGYRVTLSARERLMAIVALTPRLKNDLIEQYGVEAESIQLIPNGLNPEPFAAAASRVRALPETQPVQLGFMGRLEHKQKGVLYLPEIVRSLKQKGVPFHLKIAGKGVHRAVLAEKLKSYINAGDVELVGALDKSEVPAFLKATDIFLFTSHFEGCPNALLEAMMAGCVPVALLIEGITDFLIDHGRTGFVAPMVDYQLFAQYTAQLIEDRALLRRLSAATADSARDRFTSKTAARRYAQLFHAVQQAPLLDFEPLPWSQFRVDPVYRKKLSGYLPKNVKKLIKSAMNKPPLASYLQRSSL